MIAWLLTCSFLFAQNILPSPQNDLTIAGRVVSGTPPVPVADATVTIDTVSVVTGADGRFAMTVRRRSPQQATVTATVSAAGFADAAVDVALAGQPIEITLSARPAVRENVLVSASAGETATALPSVALVPRDVKTVPGAVDNVFRVLQTMPGVSGTDDFGSRLSVRGGGPDQNLTVMDDVEIHNPYRLFGLTSAFNPETIDRFELTAGGFGPEYGDRLSSIFVVQNRAGVATRGFAGSAALSITDANVVLEGALPASVPGSWIVSGRRTYYDLFAEHVTHDDLPSFNDLQARVVWAPHTGRQISFFALRSREATDALFDGGGIGNKIGLTDSSQNDVAALTLTSPVGRRATSKTVVSWYRYSDGLGVAGSVRDDSFRTNSPDDDETVSRATLGFRRNLGVRDVALRESLTVPVGRAHLVSAGIEAHRLPTTWAWDIFGDRNAAVANGSSALGGSGLPDVLDSSGNGNRAAGWVEDDVRVTARVRLAPGVRIDWNRLAEETIASPRLRVMADLTPNTTLRLATGRYTQSPGYEKLFQSDYFVDLSNVAALGLKSERSWHTVGSIERALGGGMRARVEGYYKQFDDLIVGALETPEQTAARVAQYAFPPELAWSVPTSPQITTIPSNGGAGESYGADVYLEKRATASTDRVTGWISYTWGRALVHDYGRTYPFDYDRRHSLSLVTTWQAKPRLAVGATLRVASGFPISRAVGVRVASVLVPGAEKGAPGSLVPLRVNDSYVWSVDNGGVENLNGGRLPVYARLDLRMTFTPSRTSRWQFYVELINALNRRNASTESPELKYDPSSDRPMLTFSRDGSFPLLPSFGLRTQF